MDQAAQPNEIDEPGPVGVVLPGDNRAPVANSTIPPYRWIGLVRTTWPHKQNPTVGTGTLIDDVHLLTCAHNFYDTEAEKFCTSVQFVPACNRVAGIVQMPYGVFDLAKWAVPRQYIATGGPPPPNGGVPINDITSYVFDYAVARLARHVNDPPGPSMIVQGWPGNNAVGGLMCEIVGYSGDLDNPARTQFHRNGAVQYNDTDGLVSYQMSTYHGDSGAPVYFQPANRPYWTIVAVHVTGVAPTPPHFNNGFNFGPAMNEHVLADIQRLLNLVDQ